MKKMMQGLLFAALMTSQSGLSCTEDGQEGFLPENDLRIPAFIKTNGGITEEIFNKVIDEVESVYAPIVAQEGGRLSVDRKWADDTVNAFAMRLGSVWRVSMFGGLARHETITADGFALVVCHEVGHHIGGAPKKSSAWSNAWASNEGQADYFATLKCLRRVWLNEDNASVAAKMDIPQAVKSACANQWKTDADYNICLRGAMAGDSVAKLFAALRTQSPAKFDTPDPKIVSKTEDGHPAHQCRLDTYFQGALCEVDFNEDVAQDSEVKGTCHGSLGHATGLRPLCWFKPSIQ